MVDASRAVEAGLNAELDGVDRATDVLAAMVVPGLGGSAVRLQWSPDHGQHGDGAEHGSGALA